MTDLSRLDMPDGAWATFRTRYGWLPALRIQSPVMESKGPEGFFTALVQETVIAWHVPSESGGWLDWATSDADRSLPDSALEAVDSRWGDLILGRCTVIWDEWLKSRPDPKGTAGPSSSGQPESA